MHVGRRLPRLAGVHPTQLHRSLLPGRLRPQHRLLRFRPRRGVPVPARLHRRLVGMFQSGVPLQQRLPDRQVLQSGR